MTKEEILNNKKMKRFTKDETAHITKAMQEYADLRCKPLVQALVDITGDVDVSENAYIIAQKALQDYNKK